MLKNLVMNFVRDERGAESAECGVSTVLYAGGAVAGGKSFRDKIQDKQTEVVGAIDLVGVDG
jgi:Flp pilus assembly pilin Flp